MIITITPNRVQVVNEAPPKNPQRQLAIMPTDDYNGAAQNDIVFQNTNGAVATGTLPAPAKKSSLCELAHTQRAVPATRLGSVLVRRATRPRPA